jgi:hypothetical protein
VSALKASSKRALKKMLRPIARPVLARIRVEQQLADQLAAHLPIVLNAIATQNASAREFERHRHGFDERLAAMEKGVAYFDERLAAMEKGVAYFDERLAAMEKGVADVQNRGEFIRREVMYEARYGARSRGVEAVQPGGVDPAALPKNGEVRLNLGSGHVPREGFVNVDARDLDGVDVVADVRKLPFASGTVAEIYSSHLVEHFPIEELRRVVLPHWLEVLRPNGVFTAVTPDAETMIAEAAAGRMPFDDLQRVTFGDQDYDGDFHFAMFTPDSFAGLLTEAGFSEVEIVERGRRNGLCYEFEVRAQRRAGEQQTPNTAIRGA